jgi:hypothetical protein
LGASYTGCGMWLADVVTGLGVLEV